MSEPLASTPWPRTDEFHELHSIRFDRVRASIDMSQVACTSEEWEPIWSTDALREYTEHDEASVRAWACRRLRVTAPDRSWASIAVEHLSDAPRVRYEAVNILEEDATEDALPALRRALESAELDSGFGRKAAIQLARLGHDEDRRNLLDNDEHRARLALLWATEAPGSFRTWLRRRLDDDFELDVDLLRAYVEAARLSDVSSIVTRLERIPDKSREPLMRAILRRASGASPPRLDLDDPLGSFRDLVERLRRADLDLQWLDTHDLEETWGDVASRLEAERWPRVVTHLIETTRSCLLEAPDPEHRLAWWHELVDSLERLRQETESVPRWHAALARAIHAGAIRAISVEHAVRDTEELTRLLDVLLELSLDEDRFQSELESCWSHLNERQGDPEAAFDQLRPWIDEIHGRGEADRALRWLDNLPEFPTLRAARHLLGASNDGGGRQRDIAFVATDALAHQPADLRGEIDDLLTDSVDAIVDIGLGALEDQPYRWAVRAMLEHGDTLAERVPRRLWNGLRELGSPEALELARRHGREGDAHAANVATFLATLEGRRDELTDALREAAASPPVSGQASGADSTFDLPTSEHTPPVLDSTESLDVGLACRECGASFEREVERIYIDPDALEDLDGRENLLESATVSQIVECEACGTRDDYELAGRETLQLVLFLLGALESDDADLESHPVAPVQLRLEDGTVFQRPTEGIEHLEEAIEAHPEEGRLHRRLGELYATFQEDERAVEAWQRALEVDDTELEAAHRLADHFWYRGDFDRATDTITEALSRVPETELSGDAGRRTVDALLEFLRDVLEIRERPLVLEATWQPEDADNSSVSGALELDSFDRWSKLATSLRDQHVRQLSFHRDPPDEPTTRLEPWLDEPSEES